MKFAKGPRPWTIWLFLGITSYIAAFRLWDSLTDLSAATRQFGWVLPMVDWNRDLAIVAASAWFTIDMIPIVLVLAFAAKFARMFISAMALFPLATILINIEYASTYPRFLLPSILVALIPIALAGLLWTSSANRYFSEGREDETKSA